MPAPYGLRETRAWLGAVVCGLKAWLDREATVKGNEFITAKELFHASGREHFLVANTTGRFFELFAYEKSLVSILAVLEISISMLLISTTTNRALFVSLRAFNSY